LIIGVLGSALRSPSPGHPAVPEVSWVNGFRLADPASRFERPPVLLARWRSYCATASGAWRSPRK